MTHHISTHLLGSTLKTGRLVPNTEDVAVRTVLDAMQNAVVVSLPVLRAAGLELLRGAEEGNHQREKAKKQLHIVRAADVNV